MEDPSGYTYVFKIRNYQQEYIVSDFTCHHYLQDVNEVFRSEKFVFCQVAEITLPFQNSVETCDFKIDEINVNHQVEPREYWIYEAGSCNFVPNSLQQIHHNLELNFLLLALHEEITKFQTTRRNSKRNS